MKSFTMFLLYFAPFLLLLIAFLIAFMMNMSKPNKKKK